MRLILIFISFISLSVFAQPTGFAKEVFDLINMARTQPDAFLSKHKSAIDACSPQFTKIVEDVDPISAVIWDEGIASMMKEKVVKGSLNPEYPGEMDGFYLSSGGSGSSSDRISAFYILCRFYTAINNPGETHFGFYMSNGKYSFSWGASLNDSSKEQFTYEFEPDTSAVDFNKLNTARDETYMSDFERAMVKEINFVRMYPAIYADLVGKFMEKRSITWDGLDADDIFATNELIEELKSAEPFGLLYPKECIYKAAEKHGLDCKERGFMDHTGSDGSSPFERIAKFCSGADGNENLVGTTNWNVRKSVIALLVDSGISSRGHRYNMLNSDWKFIGCFQYDHIEQEYSEYFIQGTCVQNFSK